MSSLFLKPRFTFPILFFLIHTAAVIFYAYHTVPLAGPGQSELSMVWLIWLYIDFPLGIVAIYIAQDLTTNVGAVSLMIIIGGLQWAFWGWLIYKFWGCDQNCECGIAHVTEAGLIPTPTSRSFANILLT